jgi:hypothetical protein
VSCHPRQAASSRSCAGRPTPTVPYNRGSDIRRAVAPGEGYITVADAYRGGDSLLHISGWPKVEKVLHAIEVVEALGIDPADAAPDY